MKKQWHTISLAEAKLHPLYGVKNWLAIFAAGILISGLRDIGSISGEAYRAGLTISDFLAIDSPSIGFLKVALSFDALLVVVIYWLLFTKNPKFRPVSAALLIASYPAMAILGFLNPFPELGNILGQAFFSWLLTCGIWVTYLQKSRRVRVTFENTVLATEAIAERVGKAPPALSESMPLSVNSDTQDENHWLEALTEFEGPSRKMGLWAKVFSEAGGDEARAKALYLRKRSAQISEEQQNLARAVREAPAIAAQNELVRCTSFLATAGYEVVSRGQGWEIREPLGGKQRISTLTELTSYTNSRQPAIDAEVAQSKPSSGTVCRFCQSLVPNQASTCPSCKATFGYESGWKR